MSPARSDPGLRRGFGLGLLATVIGLLVIAAVIHLANAGRHRPEGIAERWLQAVSDTGRSGVRADARDRAEKVGPLALAQSLVRAKDDRRHGYFVDLEIGQAHRSGQVARVPFRLHQYVDTGTAPVLDGSVVLTRGGDTWKVTGLDRRGPDERVPSEGGAPPSRAPAGVWIGALLLGVLLAAGCHGAVTWADRSARRAQVAPVG